MAKIFNKTTELVADFNNYLDSIAQAALIFQALMRDYLRGDMENLQVHLKELQERETRCDELRREIRFRLYSRMLIPENRGDVLSILENADRMVDKLKAVAVKLDIERPTLPEFLQQGMGDLAASATASVDFTVQAAKSYLSNPEGVHDLLTKVNFHEHEADKLEDSMKRAVFADEAEQRLSAKMQLSMIIEELSGIADTAEDVSDRISIAAIKREY
jgi:predicted phosphate transport protein (TIGR00153 family)